MNIETYKYDVVILGGGAAGLAAAAALGYGSRKKLKAAIIEKEPKLGKKLLATGNGRCNLTNVNISSELYNADSRQFINDMLKVVSAEKLTEIFRSMGLLCRADSEGRVYPYSNRASSVLGVLTLWIQKNGIDVFCGTAADGVAALGGGYKIKCGDKQFIAKKLIMSTGGAVQPALGSDGSSYKFADMLGLKCTKVFPSLAPVKVNDKELKLLKGVRAKALVKLEADGRIEGSEYGEVQFNENNISGICVFQLSRMVNEYFSLKTVCGKRCAGIGLYIDLAPEYTREQIYEQMQIRSELFPKASVLELASGIVHERICEYIIKKCGIDPRAKLSEISKREKTKAAAMIKSLEFTPSERSDETAAQVTAGGISIGEVDKVFMSKKHNGLYVVGEALNADGKCGGCNLHFAFASGFISGRNAASAFGPNSARHSPHQK